MARRSDLFSDPSSNASYEDLRLSAFRIRSMAHEQNEMISSDEGVMLIVENR